MIDNLPLILIGAALAWKFWPQLLAVLQAGKETAGDVVEVVADAVTTEPAAETDALVKCGLEAFGEEKRHRVGFLMKLRADYSKGESNGVAVRYINYLIRCETEADDIDQEWEEEENYEE